MNNNYYFETIKCKNYEIFNLEYHIKRIFLTIGLHIDLSKYITPPSDKLLKCKVIYDEKGIHDILFTVYTTRTIKSFQIIFNNDIIYDKKSLNRDAIDNLYLQKNSADEIMIIKNNLLADTSIANIAIYFNNHWITPKHPLLNGTCKNRYVENKLLEEKDISVDMLKKATKIALLNAMVDMYIIEDFKLYLD